MNQQAAVGSPQHWRTGALGDVINLIDANADTIALL